MKRLPVTTNPKRDAYLEEVNRALTIREDRIRIAHGNQGADQLASEALARGAYLVEIDRIREKYPISVWGNRTK